MKSRLVALLETIFVWTVGPVLLFFFSPKARKARYVTAGAVGTIAAAWWTGLLFWVLGMAIGQVPNTWLGGPVSAEERLILERTLTESVDEGTPVYEHALRLERRAVRFAELEGVHPGALQAAALLHDATLEHPQIPPEHRFCTHGQTGTLISVRVLRQLEERSGWYALAVGDAVLRHVGPTGFNWEWQDKRWASKKCSNRLITPVSKLSKALYDLDMLDHMTVSHVVDEAMHRRTQPVNAKKSLEQLLKSGTDSILKEMSDQAQTLQTRTGRACGKQVHKHVAQFIRTMDYRKVRTLPQLQDAARQYLSNNPTPACLDNPAPATADVSDEELQAAGGSAVE